MKKETYLMVNGKKIELTAEQKKQLGLVETKHYFERVDGGCYYSVKTDGTIGTFTDVGDCCDNAIYSAANYCTDKDLMHQRSLHETLNRLLWRYSMTHDGDKIDWENRQQNKWFIGYDYPRAEFPAQIGVGCRAYFKADGLIYFYSKEIADSAIEEVVKPFMREHPDFVW